MAFFSQKCNWKISRRQMVLGCCALAVMALTSASAEAADPVITIAATSKGIQPGQIIIPIQWQNVPGAAQVQVTCFNAQGQAVGGATVILPNPGANGNTNVLAGTTVFNGTVTFSVKFRDNTGALIPNAVGNGTGTTK